MNKAFREYLNRPRMLTAKLNDAVTQFHELWAACTKQTTSFDAVGGHGGGGGDAKDGILAAYADFRNTQIRLRDARESAREDIRDLLTRVADRGDPRSALLLELRYLDMLEWDDVHDRLVERGHPCRALRTVLNWHGDALLRAERIWEERNGKDE